MIMQLKKIPSLIDGFALVTTIIIIEILASKGMVQRSSVYAGLSASVFVTTAGFLGMD